MNCENPSIIINPSLFKVWHLYPYVNILGSVYNYIHRYRGSRNRGGKYPTYFCAKRTGVTLDTLDKCFAFNSEGDTIPFYIAVPCGKCAVCSVSKQMQFGNRLMLEQYAAELRGTPLSYFVTLTYAPKFLPKYGVCKRDVQLFLKRLRITLERKFNIPPFRYCVFSEYGKNTHRAHYHMILFGVDLGKLTYPFHVLEKYIRKTWQMGFVDVKPCHDNSFKYLSKYLLKGSNVPDEKNPNFYLASNRNGGLGCGALADINIVKELYKQTDCRITIRVLGKLITMYIPKQVVDYFFRECSSKYRSKLGEHVWNVIKNLHDLRLTFCKHTPTLFGLDQLSLLLRETLSRLQFISIDPDILKDCETNFIPKFIINRYPFLYDIWCSNYKGEILTSPIAVRDAVANLLNSLNLLQDKIVDVALISENDLFLRKFKDYFKLCHGNSQKDSESLVAYRCRLVCFNASNLPDRHPD